MVQQNNRMIGTFQILLGAAFFGLIPIFIRLGENINTSSLVFFRAFFGTIFIYLAIRLSGNHLAPFKEDKPKLIVWTIILLLAIGSYFTALKNIDIASAALLLYSQAIFIVLFSKFWLKEKIYRHTLLALVLSIISVILIISPSGFKFEGDALGYLFALCAAFFAGLSFMFPKKYFKSYDTYSMTFYQNILQLPILIIFVITNPPVFTAANVGIFAGLGLFGTALSFLLIYAGSRKVPGQYIGILQTTEAIVPIILGMIIFYEIPSLQVVFGGVLLIVGYLIIAMNERKRR